MPLASLFSRLLRARKLGCAGLAAALFWAALLGAWHPHVHAMGPAPGHAHVSVGAGVHSHLQGQPAAHDCADHSDGVARSEAAGGDHVLDHDHDPGRDHTSIGVGFTHWVEAMLPHSAPHGEGAGAAHECLSFDGAHVFAPCWQAPPLVWGGEPGQALAAQPAVASRATRTWRSSARGPPG